MIDETDTFMEEMRILVTMDTEDNLYISIKRDTKYAGLSHWKDILISFSHDIVGKWYMACGWNVLFCFHGNRYGIGMTDRKQYVYTYEF